MFGHMINKVNNLSYMNHTVGLFLFIERVVYFNRTLIGLIGL